MDAESSNKSSALMPLTPKEKMDNLIRELIETLEELLCIEYNGQPANTMREFMGIDLAKLMIGYHRLINEEHIAEDNTALRWLNIESQQMPTPDQIFKMLEQPHIVATLARRGMASYRFPLLNFNQRKPSAHSITISESETTCMIEGYQNVVYLYTAMDIVQAQVAISKDANVLSEVLQYKIRFMLGKMDQPSIAKGAPKPFQHPINLSVLVYNVMGADFGSFEQKIKSMVECYKPSLLILMETRLDRAEAIQLSMEINYQQMIVDRPLNYNGGIWMFCNLINVSMKELIHTEGSIIVNLMQIN